MEITDLLEALRRRWLVIVGGCAAVLAVWAVTQVMSPHPATVSGSLLMQPTNTDLGTEQYALAALPLDLASRSFHQRVRANVAPALRAAEVTLSGATDETTGYSTVLATSTSIPAAEAWEQAALSLAGDDIVSFTPGLGSVSLSSATVVSTGSRKVAAVQALGAGILVGLGLAVLLEFWRRRSSPAERVALRLGVPVFTPRRHTRPGGDVAELIASSRPVYTVTGDVSADVLDQALDGLREDIQARGGTVEILRMASGHAHDASGSATRAIARVVPPSQIDTAIAAGVQHGATVLLAAPPLQEQRATTLASLLRGRLLLVAEGQGVPVARAIDVASSLRVAGAAPAAVVVAPDAPHRDDTPTAAATPAMPATVAPAAPATGASPAAPADPAEPAGAGSIPQRLVRNVLATYGATAVAGVFTLILTPFALHRLGRTEFGIYALLQTVSEYLLLANIGFGTATLKLISEDVDQERGRILRTFNTSAYVLTCFAAVALAAALALSVTVLPGLFGVPANLRGATVVSFCLLAVAIAPQIPGSAMTGIILGHQRYDIEGLLDTVGILVTGLGTVIALLAGGGLVGAAIAIATGYLVMLVIPWFPARRLVPGLRISRRLIDRSQLQRMWHLSGWYLVENVANAVGAEADLVIVGLLLGVRQIALFTIAFQLSRLAMKAIGPFTAVFFPHVSSVSNRPGAEAELRGILRDGTRVTLAVAIPVALIIAFLAASAVHVWVGSGFAEAARITVLLVAATAVIAVATVGIQVIVGLGRARMASIVGGATTVVHIGAGVALATRYGATGVAIGTLIAAALVYAPITLLLAFRLVGERFAGWARACLLPHVVPSAVTALALALAAPHVHGSSIRLAVIALLAFALYLAAYLATGAPPSERASVLGRFSRWSAA